MSLLQLLHQDSLVIAGGAAFALSSANAFFDCSCDVDLFVLHGDRSILKQVVSDLEAHGYLVCISLKSHSVFTAVGVYGQTRVQIILSEAKSFVSLLDGFDLNYCKAAYTGTHMKARCCAQIDWITMTVNSVYHCGKLLDPSRLVRAVAKGFRLDACHQEHVMNAVGWPIPPAVFRKCLHHFPMLVRGVPFQVVHQMMLVHRLLPLSELSRKEVFDAIVPMPVADANYDSAETR